MLDPGISARAGQCRAGHQNDLHDGGMELVAARPVALCTWRGLQKLEEGFGILHRAGAAQQDASIALPLHAHAKISFKSSTNKTAPSPNRVVPA